MHTSLCDADDDTPMWERPPSAFPSCEGEGSLVPLAVCDNAMMFSGQRTTCCKPAKKSTLIPHQKASLLAQTQCGYPGEDDKIQKGNDTQPGEFPWLVALRYRLHPARICGGTLVHPRYILTAAHCVRTINSAKITVHLGSHLLLSSDTCLEAVDCSPHAQLISIEKKIVHTQHDIALLRLSSPANIVPGAVVPICLPIYNSLLMHLPTTLTITGWGMSTDKQEASNILLKANTEVLQNQTGCDIEQSFCAGGVHYSNHCQGDSGGPYQARDMYNESVRYVQYGVISRGSQYCENPDQPSRGILVGYFIQWILNNMDLP
uniref:Peptidase S1 domain-containing protein n=1 Tax=Anopheles atroparvus TaxID=41427 RepID=A0AAG5DIC2_ANOAO